MEAYPSINPQSANANLQHFRQQALQLQRSQAEAELLGALLNAEPVNQRQILAESMQGEKPSFLNKLLQVPTKQQMLVNSPIAQSLMGQLMAGQPDDPYAGLSEEERQKALRIKAGLIARAAGQQDDPYAGLSEEERQKALRIKAGLVPRATGDNSTEKFTSTPWYLSPNWINTKEGQTAQDKLTNGMSHAEQIKMWQAVQSSALGSYYGVEGGNADPRNPEVASYAEQKLKSLMRSPQKTLEKTFPKQSEPPEPVPMQDSQVVTYGINSRKKYINGKAVNEEQQSPYEDYPDAFFEDGVWKVMVKGKKFRIEE